jgi:hypothetical protein
MANLPAGSTIPGVVSPTAGYPQYGVSQVSGKYVIKEAANPAAKQADIDAGYVVWFPTRAAANSYISSESSLLNGNVPSPATILGLPTLSNLRGLMVRSVKVAGGLLLLFIGLNMLAKDTTNVDIMTAAKSAAKLGALA